MVGIASSADAAVAVGRNVSVFPNADMVEVSGYTRGQQLLVQVYDEGPNGNLIGTASGPAVALDSGFGLSVNHEGTGNPGDCWTGSVPNIDGGDFIKVTSSGTPDTMTVADVELAAGGPTRSGNTVSLKITSSIEPEVGLRYRRPGDDFRPDPQLTQTAATSYTASYTGTSAEAALAMAADWEAVVDPTGEAERETTIAEWPFTAGPVSAVGCPGGGDPEPDPDPEPEPEPEPEVGEITVPRSVSFGKVRRGGTAEKSVTVLNEGPGNLAINSFGIRGTGFTVVSEDCGTLAANATCSVLLRFTASSRSGQRTGTLTIANSDRDEGTKRVALRASVSRR